MEIDDVGSAAAAAAAAAVEPTTADVDVDAGKSPVAVYASDVGYPWITPSTDADSPSRRDGTSPADEFARLVHAYDTVAAMGKRTTFVVAVDDGTGTGAGTMVETTRAFTVEAIATAYVYIRAFFSRYSVSAAAARKGVRPTYVALACLCLAAKATSEHMKVDDVFTVGTLVRAHRETLLEARKRQQRIALATVKDGGERERVRKALTAENAKWGATIVEEIRDAIVANEQRVMCALEFNFNVVLPHAYVPQCLSAMYASPSAAADLLPLVWPACSDAVRAPAVLVHHPVRVALAVIDAAVGKLLYAPAKSAADVLVDVSAVADAHAGGVGIGTVEQARAVLAAIRADIHAHANADSGRADTGHDPDDDLQQPGPTRAHHYHEQRRVQALLVWRGLHVQLCDGEQCRG